VVKKNKTDGGIGRKKRAVSHDEALGESADEIEECKHEKGCEPAYKVLDL
jgi:hypothetical protein